MSQGKGKKGSFSSGGARKNRHHHYNKNKVNVGDRSREVLENINEHSPVIQQFRGYSAELDKKHDRYERIVKFSRDVTIESKRIIFLLHTIDKESKKDAVLVEAKLRFLHMAKTLFKNIALELDGQDVYQYLRAYKSGVEEYIEAITFYQYLQDNSLQDWDMLEKSLTYTIPKKEEESDAIENPESKTVQMSILPNEYILGIADLTGELMRKCINNLASGDIASCYQTCAFVRSMYKGFLKCVGVSGKEINRKMYTLKQSLTKMENVCYTIKVRGSEIPKYMLADMAIVATEEYTSYDDEGYQGY
ncbi:translin-associated protein X [Orussus abietinus]|uniref:translin-associated protein X n=1 Tax=Orussus abietinus TaxID=222816 RepID=UPI0006250E9C|nr:translin-associated protein X [Orussus abietinus]